MEICEVEASPFHRGSAGLAKQFGRGAGRLNEVLISSEVHSAWERPAACTLLQYQGQGRIHEREVSPNLAGG